MQGFEPSPEQALRFVRSPLIALPLKTRGGGRPRLVSAATAGVPRASELRHLLTGVCYARAHSPS